MQSTELKIGELLSLHNLKLSVAESCSAGGISSKICSVLNHPYLEKYLTPRVEAGADRKLGISALDRHHPRFWTLSIVGDIVD